MRLSQKGVEFIKKYERLRLDVYDDGYGYLTVGWGHRVGAKPVAMTISRIEAENLFSADVGAIENALGKLLTMPMPQNKYDAVVSLVFNIGVGNFSESSMLKMINTNLLNKAAGEFGRWIFAGGKPSAGLIKRRAEEALMYIQ